MIRPTFAAVGGWDLKNPVAQGASTVYDATKNVLINGKKFIKESSVKITPTASQVAKVLARGGAGYALSVAVEQLIGSVDWVLDPANNQITWSETREVPVGTAYWITQINEAKSTVSASDSCTKYMNHMSKYISYGSGISYKNPSTYYYHTHSGGKFFYCQYDVLKAGVLQSTEKVAGQLVGQSTVEEKDKKTMPLEVVAQKVISNAESGDTNAQAATTAAAADIVAEAEKDDAKARPIASQAEANATTKPADAAEAEKANEAQGEAKPNEANPEATDLSLTFPIFCNWAPTICEAAQTVISFPATLTEWWETANEWALSISEAWAKVKEEYANKPTENTDTQLDLPDQPEPNVNTDISFGGSCPASRSVPVSFAGIHTEIEFSFQWFCEVASIAKPVVISISAFAAALIVAGVRTEDD